MRRTSSRHGRWILLLTSLMPLCLAVSASAEQAAPTAQGPSAFVSDWLERNLQGLVTLYRDLHARPELSLQEEATARLVAGELRRAGYEVSEGVGGHGVVAVLANGAGPTLLLRGDMDALPVTEETGLEYASKVVAVQADGREVGVMHACGHDVHTTNLVGVARMLALGKAEWAGTLIVLAQPAEELGRGALAMIGAGLFDRFPRPDYTLALHVEPELPAGSVGLTSGFAFANVDAVDIEIFGRGGHGARPHKAADPIVAAAYMVTALQTIVSRRVDPLEPAVVTVGSIHGGNKHNVIPDSAHLQLTVRSYSDGVRQTLLDGIRQIAAESCEMLACAAPPEVAIRENYTPAVYNDPELTVRARTLFEGLFGVDQVVELQPSMGGEDFGRYARTLGVPGLIFRVGVVSPADHAASVVPGAPRLPSLHSSRFAPVPEPTLETSVVAMGQLALELLAPTAASEPPAAADQGS